MSISLIKEGIPINRVLKPDIPSLTLANGLVLCYKNNTCPKRVNSFLKGKYVRLECKNKINDENRNTYSSIQ